MKWILLMIMVCCFSRAVSAQTIKVDSLAVQSFHRGPSPWLLGASLGTLGAQRLFLHPRKQDVPREGLDPENVWLGIDRDAIRAFNSHKDFTSDMFMWTTVAYPNLERLLLGEDRSTWLRSGSIQLEATALATLTTFLLKSAISRPRPYTYLHTYSRSNEGPNWATSDQTFESLPSGHATLAWVSSMSRLSLTAIHHPQRSKATHILTGFVSGALATASSLLRVEAGAHFPSDIVAGSLVGGGIGYALPLLYAEETTPRTRKALSWGLWGTLGGVLVGVLMTPPTSPFVH